MKLVHHNQGSPQWKEWRSGAWLRGKRTGGGLGGSDIAAVLGVSPYPDHTRATVFAEKVHGTERDVTFAMHRGTRLEPAARDAYQRRTRCTAPPVCVEMDGCPWARVSLDGLAHNGAVIDRLQWILELKCPNWETHALALEGVVPEHFLVQCQWQLLVCGLDRLDFASFNPTERFTPSDWPLVAPWRAACRKWLAVPKCDRGKRPELLDLWLDAPAAARPPQPAEWLAVHPIEPDHACFAWILEEASRFWLEVEEARMNLKPVEVA